MTRCRYDRTAEDYLLPDGEPCRTDDYGDPTRHCTARTSCSQHIGRDDLTCPRCIGRVRGRIARIVQLSELMLPAAIGAGVQSEAANLAGPAADPEGWTWRKVAANTGGPWHMSLDEDDDDRHPYLVLGRWDLMIREDYRQPSDEPVTIANAADYLDRQLARIAQDETQDFPQFAREIGKCHAHLEGVLANLERAERGTPCPRCVEDEEAAPRLIREYPHWCEDPDCERIHYSVRVDRATGDLVPDTSGDIWACPRERSHWWTHEDYAKWVEERRAG
jgi:hypothetical protein